MNQKTIWPTKKPKKTKVTVGAFFAPTQMDNNMNYEKLSKQVDNLKHKVDISLDETIDAVDVENKKLKDALKSQLPLQMTWEMMTSEAKTLVAKIENEADEALSTSVSAELRDSYRSSSITEAKEFAKCDKDYRKFRRLAIEAKAVLDDCKSALETVTTRKFVIHNLTSAIVASVDTSIL
jgi:regulator of replication initiation timing